LPLDLEAPKVSLIVAFSAAGSDSGEMSAGGTKRQRLEEMRPAEADLKSSEELQELMGGRKHIKEEELTRAVLLE
jgi:hypothetical protein